MDASKVEGDRIVQCSWISVIVFAIAALLGYFDALKGVSVAICVVLFIASFPVWIYALIAAFSFATTSAGVPAGPTMPNHPAAA